MSVEIQIDDNSTKVMRAVFEAAEVQTPTCFVLRKEKLPQDVRADFFEKATDTLFDKVLDCAKASFESAVSKFVDVLGKEELFLYLLWMNIGNLSLLKIVLILFPSETRLVRHVSYERLVRRDMSTS